MQEELGALLKNQTWVLSDLPPNVKPITCKWTYKIKRKPDGVISKYKARLVAKGYLQVYGLDYNESFAYVAKVVTVRLFFAIVVHNQWIVHQLDINIAFLHGFLEEDLYLVPPLGLEVPQGKVCKLVKALYGLKQASQQWYTEFSSKLFVFGFVQSTHDHCLFFYKSDVIFASLIVYVDDILLTGNDPTKLMKLSIFWMLNLQSKTLVRLIFSWGLKFTILSKGISFSWSTKVHSGYSG